MIRSRNYWKQEAKDAANASLAHRRNSQHGDGTPGSDQVVTRLRNAADREETRSIHASEQATKPAWRRFGR